MIRIILILFSTFITFSSQYDKQNTEMDPYISKAFKDIFISLNINSVVIVDERRNDNSLNNLTKMFQEENIVTTLFTNVRDNENSTYFDHLTKCMENSIKVTTLFLCRPNICEDLLIKSRQKKLIRRNLLFIFYWGKHNITSTFIDKIDETMRIVVVTNPRGGVLYYNQDKPQQNKRLALVNWWSGRLFNPPALPNANTVFNNFEGKIFKVPVFHAPPWYFVVIHNDSTIEVTGGRDHKLLVILAEKLNFRYEYFDPPDHSQGSGVGNNGSIKGVLGIIQRREADFFLGDVTVTWERQQGVEFSFFTLADSGAFVTHAPRRLSETFALLRPFRWQVWPAVVATVLISGPALWAAAAGSALWRPFRAPPPPPMSTCVWFITSIFLKQSGRVPSENARARALTLLLSLVATYVLADVYSATLTSLLARPGREPPLVDLFALEKAMKHSGYSLVVERHSSSLAILQNGTGVYGRLWNLMQKQRMYAVKSVEQGVRKMLQSPDAPVALLAGRETLYFDTKRFGAANFQLSEKLYTRYSAIAMQQGCPYLHKFNRVLMQLFEAGILTKMTVEEFEKLGESGPESSNAKEDKKPITNPSESTQKLEPINIKMVQGAFYILGIGYLISGLALFGEVQMKKRKFHPMRKATFFKCSNAKRVQFKYLRKLLVELKSQASLRWQRATELSEVSLDFVD